MEGVFLAAVFYSAS